MATKYDRLFNSLFKVYDADEKLNLDRIREHIIRCIVALNKEYKLDDHEVMKQHVFGCAVQLLVKEDFVNEDESHEDDVTGLIDAFQIEEETCHTRGWHPLHWAVALKDRIKEEVVHELFLASPTCLIEYLDERGNACPGFTPVDLLVMQKSPNMSLVRYFDLQSPKLFTSSRARRNGDVFPLHLAAEFSENLELLQYLLQTHFAAVTYNDAENDGQYPLSLLVGRDEFPTFDSMLQCLLDASSDSDVIGAAIKSVIVHLGDKIENTGRILKLVEVLLNVNPSAAMYVDADNDTYFHLMGNLKDPVCTLGVMKLLLVHYPLGLEATSDGGSLPIHDAVKYCTVEVAQFVLQVHPSSIETRDNPGLMHCAVMNPVDAGMVPYLCSIAPQLLHDLDDYGFTPLALLCHWREPGPEDDYASQIRYARMRTMCETDPTVVRDETREGHRLPLHLLLRKRFCEISPTSDFADCFRLLLRLHPSAAEALDSDGESSISYAIMRGVGDYFIRLLLSASANAEHKAWLSERNHQNRSNLLFLSFSALSRSRLPTIFARLRQSHRESLKVVASFL